MKNSPWITGLAVVVWLLAAGAASAQFFGGYNRFSGYGGYGGWSGAGQYNTGRDIAAQDRTTGQMAAAGQNYVVQSGIRNTLSSQGQQRTSAILSQQQANKDWWFEHQQQQMDARKAQQYAGGMPGGGGLAVGAAPSAASLAPPAPRVDEVIPWPPLLQEKTFAACRARIEAPYRRSSTGLSAPTTADFQAMARAVTDMQAVLEWRLSAAEGGLDTTQYNNAKTFLERLGQEIGRHAQATASR